MKQLFIALSILVISNYADSQVILDELNGSTLGTATGVNYVATPNGQGAVLSRTAESRIEYPKPIFKNKRIDTSFKNIFYSSNDSGLELDQFGYAFKNGKHYLVWSNGRSYPSGYGYSLNYDNYVKLSISSDGINWTTSNIIPTTYGSYNHRIAIDNYNNVHITYTDITEIAYYGPSNAQVVYATNKTGNWLKQTVVNGSSNYTFFASALITINQMGIVSVFYHSDCWWVYGCPLLVKKYDGTSWGSQITVSNYGTRNLYDDRENILKAYDYENGKLVLYVSSGFHYQGHQNLPSIYSNNIFKIIENGDSYDLNQTISDARNINVSNGKILKVSADQKSLYMNDILIFNNKDYTIEQPTLSNDGTFVSFMDSTNSYILKKIGSNYLLVDSLVNQTCLFVNNEVINKSAWNEVKKTVYIDTLFTTSESLGTNEIQLNTSGTLSALLTKLQKDTITKITIRGNIDARDFKCMRDEMTVLAEIDISNTNITEYEGYEGTLSTNTSVLYPANEIPLFAFNSGFHNGDHGEKKTLKKIKFPNNLISIGNGAFYFCSGIIGDLNFPISLARIGHSAFTYCTGITGSLILPKTLNSIGAGAFSGCTGITGNLKIPKNVSFIDVAAFSYCKITNFEVEAGNIRYCNGSDGIIYTLQKDTIIICPGTKTGTIEIPASVKRINQAAFWVCPGLTGALNIPNTVLSIGIGAFSGTNVTSVTIPNTIKVIENNTFGYNSSLKGTFTIPASVDSIENTAFIYCDNITEFNISSENKRFCSIDGVIFSKAQDSLFMCPLGKAGGIILSDKIRYIYSGAFYKNINLKWLFVNNSNPSSIRLQYLPFRDIKTTCRLIVPKGSLAAYKAAPQWNEFTQIVEANSITVQIGANGTVAENSKNVINGGSIMAIDNQSSTFTIAPSPGYEVATLTYNGANVISQLVNNTFTTPAVVADGTLSVTFKRSIYKISVKLGGKGTMNLSYYYGDTPMFDFTPTNDAKIQSVFFNGVDVTANLVDNIYTMDPITTNGLLEVVFVSTATSVNNAADRIISITKSNNTIHIQGTRANDKIALFSTNGSLISITVSESESVNISVATNGLYLLRINGKTYKIAL